MRARYEPELAFRIAGKVSKRLVEVGDRVKKDQAPVSYTHLDVYKRQGQETPALEQ